MWASDATSGEREAESPGDIDWRAILERHIETGAVPPFVYCYPFRSAYRPLRPGLSYVEFWEKSLSSFHISECGIYLHFPFEAFSLSRVEAQWYVGNLLGEIAWMRELLGSLQIRTVYLGGGVPLSLTIEDHSNLMTGLGQLLPSWQDSCLEAGIALNPAVRLELLSALAPLGYTRINFSLCQSSVIRHRVLDKSQRQAIIAAHQAGFSNISADFFISDGVKGPMAEGLVKELIELGVDTISVYPGTVRPSPWYHHSVSRSFLCFPDYYTTGDKLHGILLGQGYIRESNVRYKIPGRGGFQQKTDYFSGIPLFGIGPGARSYTPWGDYLNGSVHNPGMPQVRRYYRNRAETQRVVYGFILTEDERLRRQLVLNLFDLTASNDSLTDFARMYRLGAPQLEAAAQLGLVDIHPLRLRLTPAGFKYRDILSWMLISEKVRERDAEFYTDLHGSTDHSRTYNQAYRKVRGFQPIYGADTAPHQEGK